MAEIKLRCLRHPPNLPGLARRWSAMERSAMWHSSTKVPGAASRVFANLDRDCTTKVTGAQCFHRLRGDIEHLSQLTMDLPTLEKMSRQASLLFKRLFCCFVAVSTINAEEPCHVETPTAVFSIPNLKIEGRFDTDPKSAFWSKASSAWISKDCSRERDYPDLQTEVRGLWTDTDVYFLFTCPYRKLNVFLPAQNDRPRDKLWDRDVVEMFLGDDWKNIRHYREFEIAPTGDWIDLAIDLDHKNYDKRWRSGWQVLARIDEAAHRWFAAARIPLKSVSETLVQPGTRWRMNLYRIEGEGPDSQRHFLCWQPTCVANRDPNHVPEAFGTLVFQK